MAGLRAIRSAIDTTDEDTDPQAGKFLTHSVTYKFSLPNIGFPVNKSVGVDKLAVKGPTAAIT